MRQEFKDKTSMPTTFDGRDIVNRLELREQFRSRVSRIFGRRIVARKAGVAAGTLERIAADRVKDIRDGVKSKLIGLLIRELEAEIRANEHELQLLRQTGAGLDSDEIREIETHLAKARAILNGA